MVLNINFHAFLVTFFEYMLGLPYKYNLKTNKFRLTLGRILYSCGIITCSFVVTVDIVLNNSLAFDHYFSGFYIEIVDLFYRFTAVSSFMILLLLYYKAKDTITLIVLVHKLRQLCQLELYTIFSEPLYLAALISNLGFCATAFALPYLDDSRNYFSFVLTLFSYILMQFFPLFCLCLFSMINWYLIKTLKFIRPANFATNSLSDIKRYIKEMSMSTSRNVSSKNRLGLSIVLSDLKKHQQLLQTVDDLQTLTMQHLSPFLMFSIVYGLVWFILAFFGFLEIIFQHSSSVLYMMNYFFFLTTSFLTLTLGGTSADNFKMEVSFFGAFERKSPHAGVFKLLPCLSLLHLTLRKVRVS